MRWRMGTYAHQEHTSQAKEEDELTNVLLNRALTGVIVKKFKLN